jgi:hypothetical protein
VKLGAVKRQGKGEVFMGRMKMGAGDWAINIGPFVLSAYQPSLVAGLTGFC